MASRRMFSLDVVDTDKFLDMPLSAQCLYFHLGMRADDDGFIDSPKKTLKYIGSNDDDFKLLIAKGYLIPFDDGVVVITDWLKNNWIRADRKKDTRYKEKLSSLSVRDDSYCICMHENTVNCQPLANQTPTTCQPSDIPRIGKDRIDKDRIGEGVEHGVYFTENPPMDNPPMDIGTTNSNKLNSNNINNNSAVTSGIPESGEGSKGRTDIPYQEIADMYNAICTSYPRLTKLSEARKKAIRARCKQYSLEDFKRLFEMAEGSGFLKGSNDRNWSATFDWLIKDANMAKVLDGNYSDKGQQSGKGQQPKKQFQQFTQREYTKEQMDDMERTLLNR